MYQYTALLYQYYHFTLNTFHSQEDRGEKTPQCDMLRKRRACNGSEGSGIVCIAEGKLPNSTRYIIKHNTYLIHDEKV